MAYKSLYRKYRPSKFEDVYGQKYIVQTLCNAIENNKISHAYLFNGTRGTGKTTIAKIFAKMVNCPNKINNKPCGMCEICTCENTDEIPDIIEIDAASNNGVDEIRELKNKIKLMPVSCKYKVYIIDEVHMLSTGAFNALLKTLEEPPEHVIFILATTEPQKIPITIISRCQRFDFKKISEQDIVNRLRYIAECENINVSNEALIEIAKISGGAMRDAIGLLDQLSSYSDSISIEDIYVLKGSISIDTLFLLCDFYVNRKIDELLDLIENIYNEGKNFNLLVDDILNVFRNVLICKKARIYFDNKNITNKEKIIDLSNKLDENEIERIIFKLEELSKNIKNSNYSRILFEVTLLSDFNNKDNLIVEDKIKTNNDIKDKTNVNKNNKPDNNIGNNKAEIKPNEQKVEVEEKQVEIKPIEPIKITKDKNILINNTIAQASTIYKKNATKAFLNLDKYLIDEKYRNAATILKDATIAATSIDHILLTYKYAGMVEENDIELYNIMELLSKLLNTNYKVVAITEDEWKIERPKYIELKKQNKLEIIEEKVEEITSNTNNEEVNNLIDMFGSELVEMEG